MRIIFLGSGPFAIPTLRALSNSAHHIVTVVTQPDRAAGRGRKVVATPVKRTAEDLGCPVISPGDVNATDVVRSLAALDAHLGVVIDFGQKIGPDLINALAGGCINLHGSLLPKYRGAAPIQRAILAGEERTGVTVFRLVQRMDAGPILTTRWTWILPDERADELAGRLAAIGPDAMSDALRMFDGGAVPDGEPQDDGLATTAPKLRKTEGAIDFHRPAEEVVRRVRAMWSWPGARATFVSADGTRTETIIVAAARVAELPGPSRPVGELDYRLAVATAYGDVEILEVKPAGGRLMDWPAFVNGRHVTAGDRLASG